MDKIYHKTQIIIVAKHYVNANRGGVWCAGVFFSYNAGRLKKGRVMQKITLFGQVGIDMIVGFSEILVLADGTTPPDWVAMDLFSQAEHDELAQSIFLASDESYMRQVHEAMQRLLPALPRAAIIAKSLARRGAFMY